MAFFDQAVKKFLWNVPSHVVHHVDAGEMSGLFLTPLRLQFQPDLGKGALLEASDDVGDGAGSYGLKHDLHGRRPVVPIEVQPVLGAVETRHAASTCPAHFCLHGPAWMPLVFRVREGAWRERRGGIQEQPTDGPAMSENHGSPITLENGVLTVPDRPTVHYIEGDGIGIDITPVMIHVIDAAVEHAYGGQRSIAWSEVLAGEKAFNATGEWLPEATLDAMRTGLVSIKGPLTTPVGGGIRSLNVALRQKLDLFACVRPVRWYEGTPSPVKAPGDVDMVIFRENSEDVYAGIEWEAGSEGVAKLIAFLQDEMGVDKIRFPNTSGIGIKPISSEGTARIVRAAIRYAIENDRDSVTIVHKGNIMKFTEGGFRDWGYQIAKDEFGATELDGGPWCTFTNPDTGTTITVKDVIADAMLQQVLTRPREYGVLTTMNLNGDYISDALAAQVGGIGIAPGANINYDTGIAIFEATHGTAPKYTGQDKVNPGSLILSAEMMLRHMGWTEAADLVVKGMEGAISARTVTYDFERLMDGATLLSCSAFGEAIVSHMA